MTCEHGECGCDHDHQVDVTEGQQAEPHGASAGCCGGHHGPETTDASLGLRSTLP